MMIKPKPTFLTSVYLLKTDLLYRTDKKSEFNLKKYTYVKEDVSLIIQKALAYSANEKIDDKKSISLNEICYIIEISLIT